MQTNIENFYRSVSQNPALLNKIVTGANTPDEFIERAVSVAKDEGYVIDGTEAKSWIDSQIAARKNGELSDTQLEAVAGGKGSAGSDMGKYVKGFEILPGKVEKAYTQLGGEIKGAGQQVGSWLSSW